MKDLLKVTANGRLGQAPDIRYSANGNAVANFTIACNQSKKDGDQWIEYPEWIRCVAFGRTAEVIEKYCDKGTPVLIEGTLRTRQWEKDGVKRYTTEVLVEFMRMLGSTNEGGDRQAQAKPKQDKPSAAHVEDFDDDIPF